MVETEEATGMLVAVSLTCAPAGSVVLLYSEDCTDSVTDEPACMGVPECLASRSVLFMGLGHTNHATVEVTEPHLSGDRVIAMS